MRFASAYEVTSTGRGIKSDLPRNQDELQALLALAAAGNQQMGPGPGGMMGQMQGRMMGQMGGQQRGQAVKGGSAGNVIDAFHRRDCQVPFNVGGMMVDTGQPSGMNNNNRAFQQGLHIAMGNKPSLMGGGQMGGQQGRGMGRGMGQGNLARAYQGRMQMGGRSGMGGNVRTDPGVQQAKGTNCGDKVRQIDVGVMSKSGQMMTIRGLIDSGAGVALMDPAVGSMLGFGQQDSVRTIQAQGEQAQAQVPLINIMATFLPNPQPLAMQAVLFADGQDSIFTPFPTCDMTMRVTIDIDSNGHTLTAPDGSTVHYDCKNNMKTMSGGAMNNMMMAPMMGRMAMMQQNGPNQGAPKMKAMRNGQMM